MKRSPDTGRFLQVKGQYVDSKGYWCYSAGVHRGKRVHRVLAEAELGRPLSVDECVHHIDGNKLNNERSNRVVMGRSEHSAWSNKQRWFLKNHIWKNEEDAWRSYFGSQISA